MGTADGEVDGWALEVVRGRDAGRVFALEAGEVVLGNSPGDRGGLDLASQEGDSAPRRMAPRHAALDASTRGLSLRDLESPGGTFVNRRRVLPGQALALQVGDLIQLGGVQLKVVEGKSAILSNPRPSPRPQPVAAPAPAPAPATRSGLFSYTIVGGPTCRTWDDFLTASAQRWEALREELTSGRIAAFLVANGRGDFAPPSEAPGSPDERLDDWLGSLPTTRTSSPELDVHPPRLVIRATPGGGTIRKTVRVSNVGHRLLRSTARVEPTGTRWLAVAPEFASTTFKAVEGVDLPVDVHVPDRLDRPLTADLVIEGNGGSKRVAVVLERKLADEGWPDGAAPEGPAPGVGPTIPELIARQSIAARVGTWGMAALALRLVVGVAGGSIGEDAMIASGPESPKLGGVALLLASVVGVLGGIVAGRRGGIREVPSGSIAGACSGMVLASLLVATCRTVEPILGGWSSSVIAVSLLWAVLGAGLGGLSSLVVKGKPR